jgi:hypothetical protein
VYAAFAPESDEVTYVKIGMSTFVYDRLLTIATACPFRIDLGIWMDVGAKRRARTIEGELHAALAHRRTHGEWFRFEMTPGTMLEFKEAAATSIGRHCGRAPAWKQIDHEQLRAWSALRAQERNQKPRSSPP